MKVIWREESCTAQPVIDELARSRNWKPTTTRTLITRLVQKEVLTFKRQGRNYLYTPTVNQNDCRRTEAVSFLERVFDGALTPFLTALAKHGRKLREEDLAELERIVKKSQRR